MKTYIYNKGFEIEAKVNLKVAYWWNSWYEL